MVFDLDMHVITHACHMYILAIEYCTIYQDMDHD